MARTDTLQHYLSDVADAIRTKRGSSGSILASEFDTEIVNLPSGGGSDFPKFTQEKDGETMSVYLTTDWITSEDAELIQEDLFDVYDDLAFTIDDMLKTEYSSLNDLISTLDYQEISDMITTFMSIITEHVTDIGSFIFINEEGKQIIFEPTSENNMCIYVLNEVDLSDMYLYDLSVELDAETGDLLVVSNWRTKLVYEDSFDFCVLYDDKDEPYNHDYMLINRNDIAWDPQAAEDIQDIIYDCAYYYDEYVIGILREFPSQTSEDIHDYITEDLSENETIALSMFLGRLYNIGANHYEFVFDDGSKLKIAPISETSAVLYNYNDDTDLYSYTINVPPVPEPEETTLNEVKTMQSTFTDIGPIYFEKIGNIITVSCDVTNGFATDILKVNNLTITIGSETFQFANGEEILASGTAQISTDQCKTTDDSILEEVDFTIDAFEYEEISL